MYEIGRLAQVTSEMRRYGLILLGISDCRWTGSGRTKVATGETVLYSGRNDGQHRERIAFSVLSIIGTDKCLLQWKPVSSRMMSARLKGRHVNMTVIQCYTPINDSDEEDEDAFYNQLDACIVEVPKHDVLLVMEDLNAKVGSDNTHFECCLGKEGCGIRNGNGTRPVETCAHGNLVIGGTLFKHPDIHKLTWVSPNGRDINQINHVMINGIWEAFAS